MLDINLIREKPDYIKQALLKRLDSVNFDELLIWDREYRKKLDEVNRLRAERNRVSAEIPRLKKEGHDVSDKIGRMKVVANKIKEVEKEINQLKLDIDNFLLSLPNIPADDVLPGGKENNKVVKVEGRKPSFDFKFLNHIELATRLNLVDYNRGSKLGGNGYWIYTGLGAILEWGLINFFIDEHIKDGYQFILPPHLLINNCGYVAGQFPKFYSDVFHIEDEDGKSTHFLLPTAETALVNFHRDEILEEDELPKKYFAYTPCYRREAGSYRASERGMIRGHQFNKVEMFQFTKPEDSDSALDELIVKAENLVKKLGLHYRISKLAAKDCSASMGKTYDIEVWIPSMNEYKEVSSASNAYDYQARRGNIRFRRKDSKKNEFLHTLNASGLATSRLLPAILEHMQRSDGSVLVPEVLKKYVGVEVIYA